MVVKKTHHFLQYLLAIFVAYLLVTRMLISWVQYAPEHFVATAESISNSQVSFNKISVQQGWLGFKFQINDLHVDHIDYEIHLQHLDADVNLFSILVPSMHYGAYLTLTEGRYYAKTSPELEKVDVSGLDIQKLTQINLDVSRLWQRVKIKELVLSQVFEPDLTFQIYNFQSLKGAQLSIATEFGFAYKNSLNYERFSLKSTLTTNVWGDINHGELSLSSFQPLRVEKIAKLLPETWHQVLPKGDLILDLEAKISRSAISKMVVKLNSQSLNWPQKHKSLPSSLGLELVWQAQHQNLKTHFKDWNFRLSKIQLDNEYIEAISPIELSFKENNLLSFKALKFDLAPFKLIVQSLVPNRHIGALFDQTADLKIENFTGQLDWKALTLPKLLLTINKLSIPVTDYPGLTVENLRLSKDSETISFQTDEPIWLLDPKIHEDAMKINFPIGLTVRHLQDQTWQMKNQPIDIDGIKINMSADRTADGMIDSNFTFDVGTMYKLKQYLPYGWMPIELQGWLQTALVDGRNIKGSGVLQGRLEDFPFKESNGVFEVNAQVDKTYLKFDENWPTLQNFSGLIKFTPFDLQVTSDRIYLGAKAHAQNVVVDIKNLDKADIALDISGQVSTHFDRALDYLTISPLANAINLEEFIASSDFSGEVEVELERLWVPLAGYANLTEQVKGQIQFKNANMILLRQIPVERINGLLKFTEKSVSADELTADILEGKTQFSVKSAGEDKPIKIQGEGAIFQNKNAYFESPAPWKIVVSVPFKAAGSQSVDTDIKIDLTDSKSLLPAPLDQKALEGKSLHIKAQLVNDEVGIQAGIPDLLHLDTIWAKQNAGYQGKKLQLLFGKNLTLPDHIKLFDSYVQGEIDELEIEPWIALYKQFDTYAQTETSNRGETVPLNWIPSSLNIQALTIWDQVYPDVAINWLESNLKTSIKLESPDVSANLVMKPEEPLEFTVDHLQLHTSKMQQDAIDPSIDLVEENKTEIETANQSCTSQRKAAHLLPEVIFKGRNIKVDNYVVNALNFRLTDTSEMLVISAMEGKFGHQAGILKGQYLLDKALDESKLALTLTADDVQDVTRFVQLKDGFKGKDAEVNMLLDWTGGAECFSITESTGVIDFEFKDGAIEDIEPGFARLIGLLSVESIARRLQLNLKDLTNKGMVYDRIKGQAQLKQGQLTLDFFKLTAPSAKADLFGQVDLLNEEFRLKADVTPAIGASLPAIAALAGYANPLAALAVYTVMKVLPGINENLVTYHYEINGPWLDPKVQEIKAKKEEVVGEESSQEESILDQP